VTSKPDERTLPSSLVLLMAVACGAAVANIYYAQPLLSTIARDFSISDGTAGLLVTASQVGYAAGLVLLVPLGDLLERRRLITRILLLTALALAATAAAPSFTLLAAGLLVVGVTSVVAQILVPLASALAGEQERGRVVGKVMSGLLVGILIARTASGLLAQVGGWRLVFGVSAGLMLVLSAVLRAYLPEVRPTTTLSYPGLLRSVARLIVEQPTLRVRMLYGALGMGQFSVLWTTVAFLLAGSPYHYGDATIGLFGLVGLGGALAAQAAGRLADDCLHDGGVRIGRDLIGPRVGDLRRGRMERRGDARRRAGGRGRARVARRATAAASQSRAARGRAGRSRGPAAARLVEDRRGERGPLLAGDAAHTDRL
jgi:predicted MFS family arabinose efflux permease